jgi:protocatechuate 3,4-dioxygenase beta subunit
MQPTRLLFLTALLSLLVLTNTSCRAQTRTRAATGLVGGGCDGCDIIYADMPRQLSWQTTIASAAEPGERMEITGVIYHADGKTPASGVILYVYHTDARGLYSPAPDESGAARRHGHLRGWMKTDERGQYRFISIRPAPYPNGRVPAHIHPIIKEADKNEYYIDEFLFDDDPALRNANIENRGGSGIIHLSKNSEGVWVGKRDITLGLNIPNYR